MPNREAPPWFSQYETKGLHDFWRVYDANYDRITNATLLAASEDPQFGPVIRAMSPEQLAAQNLEGRERMRRAVEGAWGEYEANLRMQGAMYARMGIGYSAWYRLVRASAREILPLIVSQYARAADRGTGALLAMQSFFDQAMATLGEAYISTKEAAIREGEEDLRTTLDSIGDAVISTDTKGCIVRMNPVAETLTGWKLADCAGQPLQSVFRIQNEETRVKVEDPVERVLRDGAVVGLANHTVLIGKDLREHPIADSAAPIRGDDGTIRGVVLVFRDMTTEVAQQRRLDEEKERALELQITSRRANEASRLKSEFLANMSHELRTPLNAIIGFGELIQDGVVRSEMPEFKEFVRDIVASGHHLLQLINDVLDLSKVEAGKLEFHPEKVDLQKLMGEVVAILRATASEKRIRLESTVDARLADVVIDPGRLKQVLYNYLSNALKFTPAGGTVLARALLDGNDNFRVEVTDSGIGIKREDFARLFVEFQQLDAGAAKRHGGTGLGLALTRRLVEAQGGSVGVRSTPGTGSSFHAVLPRDASTSAVPQPTYPNADLPTVLVIEDIERDRRAIVESLTEAGYAVDVTSTAADAVLKCAERSYAAITLDLLLPDANGLELLQRIRSEPKNRDVPVIVVTMVAEHGSLAGFAIHDVLVKPLDSTTLLASLARAGLAPRGRGTVLVVDDDSASLRLMAATLAEIGYHAFCVPRGDEGLRFAAKAPPLAVLLDLIMPEMDGFEFLERFRKLPRCGEVPVIIWSVKDLSAAERARLHTTVQGLVSKGRSLGPTVVAELQAMLAPIARPTREKV